MEDSDMLVSVENFLQIVQLEDFKWNSPWRIL